MVLLTNNLKKNKIMGEAKYIRTKDNKIIVFSGLQLHSEFKHFEPVSAGFIFFSTDEDKNTDCLCYEESISLDLKSKEDDTKLAKRQILGYGFF